MEENNETIAGFEVFSNPEDLAASTNEAQEQPVLEQEAVSEQPMEEAPSQESFDQPSVEAEQPQYQNESDQNYSEPELEGAVMEFLSERLGREITSFEDFNQEQETNAIDERVEAIARFVEDTGRAPEDWFRFQSLNPEGMDDMTAIRIQMSNEYPNLSYDELSLLVDSKYKLDEDLHSEDEVRLSKLQLKIDGDKARGQVQEIRESYSAPESESQAFESAIDEEWIATMSQEVDGLMGLEFDLGEDNTFEFGLDDAYKNQLKGKQARLDEFFDSYVREDGSWDHDLLSSHMAVIDNVDRIVKSAYTKGLGDGQRTLVNTAANVSAESPQQGSQNQQTNPLSAQVKQLLNSRGGGLTFNI